MQKTIYAPVLLATLLFAACGESAKEKKGTLGDKKTELVKLKADKTKLDEKIRALETEIAKLDPASAKQEKTILVSVMPLAAQNFEHYIELQGKVDADDISYIAPRNGQGGLVKALYIKKGDYIKRGQAILKLDDAVYLKNLEQLKSQLSFAEDIYRRQKNLWDQNIGTEVQLISAKQSVESIEKQIATLKEQWSMTTVYADASGIADEVNIRVGELFVGASALGPQIKIVNTSNLKVVTDIPENYLSKVRRGTPVQVFFPDVNRTISTSISLISPVIGANTRGFVTECRLNGASGLSPNQVALVKILDYAAANAIIVPVNTIQTDEKGKYVYVMDASGSKKVARKKSIAVGESYNGMIEVRGGLAAGDQLITEGYQNLYDGQAITTETK
jgi:membrane fusion protein, multidrug efflux system